MNAQDIMTTDVATVGLQATVAEAIRLMVELWSSDG